MGAPSCCEWVFLGDEDEEEDGREDGGDAEEDGEGPGPGVSVVEGPAGSDGFGDEEGGVFFVFVDEACPVVVGGVGGFWLGDVDFALLDELVDGGVQGPALAEGDDDVEGY